MLIAKAMLGARLREVRMASGLGLAEVAAASGMAMSYLSEVERGRKLPTLTALLALADVHRVLVVDLLAEVYPLGTARRPHNPPAILDGRLRP
jgi:transcriptional regulator with XRE-family HTH domain